MEELTIGIHSQLFLYVSDNKQFVFSDTQTAYSALTLCYFKWRNQFRVLCLLNVNSAFIIVTMFKGYFM